MISIGMISNGMVSIDEFVGVLGDSHLELSNEVEEDK
jgi:hypothetical protein